MSRMDPRTRTSAGADIVQPIRWERFALLGTNLDKQLDELFDIEIESSWHGKTGAREWRPQIDVYEGEDAYLVTADLPGVLPESLTVEVKQDRVEICGERSAVSRGGGEHCVWSERWAGRFCREFPIRSAIDTSGITISHNEGVYTIRLPKIARQAAT
jgi:HSP20 family protein